MADDDTMCGIAPAEKEGHHTIYQADSHHCIIFVINLRIMVPDGNVKGKTKAGRCVCIACS